MSIEKERAEALAKIVKSFWKARGYNVAAAVKEKRGHADIPMTYEVITSLVNGLPHDFKKKPFEAQELVNFVRTFTVKGTTNGL